MEDTRVSYKAYMGLSLDVPLCAKSCGFFTCVFRRVNDIHVYAIFDGHDGSKAAQFAAQQFPLELLLGQLEGRN